MPAFVVSSFIQLRKYQIRKEVKLEIKAGIDIDELVLIEADLVDTITTLDWEHSKEFEFQGEMYDVVIRTISGNRIHYWCWRDSEETVLNGRLNKMALNKVNKDRSSDKSNRHFWSYCKQLFFESLKINRLSCIEEANVHYSGYVFCLDSISLGLETPPPKYA